MTSIILLLVGLLLIFLEFFLPGGVMGAAGGLIVIGSVVVFASGDHSAIEVLLFAAAAVVGVTTVIKLSLDRVRKADPNLGLYSNSDQEGYQASEFDVDMIGEEGEVLSDLKPSGHVVIHGRRHQAVSQSGYIKSGEKVVVIEGRGAHLIVRVKSEESTK